MTHLTEDERQAIGDGTLTPDASAEAHLRACAECSADVDRIRSLMKRAKEPMVVPAGAIDEAWQGIRARIENQKVVSLPGRNGGRAGIGNAESRIGNRGRWMMIGGLAAAGIMALWLTGGRVKANQPEVTTDSGVSLVALVDSANTYQEEAQTLLNHLELRRATMRPELKQALERDLKTIDVAIAELQNAIKTDPNNPALRRLLASSYRQKVDLLKRVGNAS